MEVLFVRAYLLVTHVWACAIQKVVTRKSTAHSLPSLPPSSFTRRSPIFVVSTHFLSTLSRIRIWSPKSNSLDLSPRLRFPFTKQIEIVDSFSRLRDYTRASCLSVMVGPRASWESK